MNLYQWQKDCLRKWEENKYRGIVNVVTGAGKTVLALAAVDLLFRKHPDLQVRIVVPTIPLAGQWMQTLLKHASTAGDIPGFFGDGRKDRPDSRIVIYIVNTARTSLSAHIRKDFALDRPVLLICDECHHYQSRENRRIFSFLNNSEGRTADSPLYHCLGLSATPFGTGDDAFLRSALGNEIFSYGFHEAAAQSIISPFYICQIAVSFMPSELKEYMDLTEIVNAALARLLEAYPRLKGMGKTTFMKTVTKIARKSDMSPDEPASRFLLATYQRKTVSVMSNTRLLCCMRLIREIYKDSRILIFCERIEQAEEIYHMIERSLSPVSGLYHSGLNADARRRILENYRSGFINILCTCRCLDEGIDVPDADTGIVISSSAVSRQRIQRMGRIIRHSVNKSYACLYYIYVRESSDDAIYLDNISSANIFSLRYFTEDDAFSNELYEYAGAVLLSVLREKNASEQMLSECRSCILEGLIHPDFLLDQDTMNKKMSAAATTHEKNYWLTVKKLHSLLESLDS